MDSELTSIVFEEEFISTLSQPMCRCACGALASVSMPSVCEKCGDHKAYWKLANGKLIRLKDMDLGHLTNTVKCLAVRVEQYPQGDFRTRIEVAMDLFYIEISNRLPEVEQLTGIEKALKASLANV